MVIRRDVTVGLVQDRVSPFILNLIFVQRRKVIWQPIRPERRKIGVDQEGGFWHPCPQMGKAKMISLASVPALCCALLRKLRKEDLGFGNNHRKSLEVKEWGECLLFTTASSLGTQRP
jgi:hypothetical protein